MLPSRQCWFVIGYIDAYGAIHHHKIYEGDLLADFTHEALWPEQTHKRWRFNVRHWDLDQSILSSVKLDSDDGDMIVAKMRKILPVPKWVQQGDAWDAAGRPRGAAYDKWLTKWEKTWAKKHPVSS